MLQLGLIPVFLEMFFFLTGPTPRWSTRQCPAGSSESNTWWGNFWKTTANATGETANDYTVTVFVITKYRVAVLFPDVKRAFIFPPLPQGGVWIIYFVFVTLVIVLIIVVL